MMDGVTAFLLGDSIIILPSTIHLIFIVFFIPSEIYNSLCMRCSLLREGTMAFFFSVSEFNLHPFLEYNIFPLPNPRTHSMEVDLRLCRFQNNPWAECKPASGQWEKQVDSRRLIEYELWTCPLCGGCWEGAKLQRREHILAKAVDKHTRKLKQGTQQRGPSDSGSVYQEVMWFIKTLINKSKHPQFSKTKLFIYKHKACV